MSIVQVDDTSPTLFWYDGWKLESDDNSFNRTIHTCSQPEASMTFPFKGTSIYVSASLQRGSEDCALGVAYIVDTDRTEVQPGADNSTNFSVQDLAPKQHTIIIKLTGKRLRCTKDKYSFDYLNYTTTSPSSRSAAPTNGSSLTSILLPSSEESSTSHKTILHSTTQHPTSSSSIMTTDMPFVSPPMAASSPGTLSPPSGYLAAIVIAAIATVVLFLLGVFLWIKRSMLKVLFGKIHVDELHGGQESRASGSLRSYRIPTSQQRSLRSILAPVPPRTREPRSAQSLSYLSTVPPGAVQNVRHKTNALSDASYLFTAQPDPFRSFSNGPTYPMAPNSVDDSLT